AVDNPGNDGSLPRRRLPFRLRGQTVRALLAGRKPVVAAMPAMLVAQLSGSQPIPVRPVDIGDLGNGKTHDGAPTIMVAWVCMVPPWFEIRPYFGLLTCRVASPRICLTASMII